MKKNIGSIILVLILCLSVVGITLAENSIVDSMNFQGEETNLSLEDAIEVTLKDNTTLKQNELDIEQAQIDYDKLNKVLRQSKKIYGERREDSVQYLEYITLIELSRDFTTENAQRNYDTTVEKLKAEVEEAYYSLLQAQQLQDINKANLEISNDLHEKTKKKFELGLIAKQEVINSELSLIKAENEYKTSEDNVKRAKMALNIKLGYDIMSQVTLKDELKYEEFKLESIAEAISEALVNRNEVKFVEYSYELAKTNMDITAKKEPEITFNYRNQVVNLAKAEKSLEDTKKNIEMEIRSNYLDVMQKYEGIKAGEKSLELAEEALRLSQLSYDVGMSVLTDVQNAQTVLLQAKMGLSKSILDYNLAVLKFEDSIGVGRTSMGGSASGSSQGGEY